MSSTLSYRSPAPCVDLIIRAGGEKILLVNRSHPPLGWALPGGFVEYGETLEEAALREGRSKTGTEIELVEQFHTYSSASRDSRMHAISTVFIAQCTSPGASDLNTTSLKAEKVDEINGLAFDHDLIIADYAAYMGTGRRPGVPS